MISVTSVAMRAMTRPSISPRLERLLLTVDKPARYVGGEFNTTLKPDAEVDVRIALAFPDVYDIGMSYHGFKIFYERINRMPGFQAERVFAPWDDFERVLRENDVPLYMLESKRPLSEADIIGFTLQHEMNYTNILNMLELGRVPVLSTDRGDSHPIVIAGGHGAFNPEVLADFIDVFVIGDGEWALEQVMEVVREQKKDSRAGVRLAGAAPRSRGGPPHSHQQESPYHYRGDGTLAKRRAVPTFVNADITMPGRWRNSGETGRTSQTGQTGLQGPLSRNRSREALLLRLAQIPGVYVPQFYSCEYNADGTLASISPNREGVPAIVGKVNFDVRDDFGAVKPVVPLLRVVHDRFAIEIKRGCMVGCRFCQAGMISRPLRERDPRQIVNIARQGIENTGYDEISLLSLSSADYSGILELTRALRNELAEEGVSISLPSLRINAFDVDLANEIGSVRKSGFTFAPEAGTARLREVINKAVDEKRFLETIESVLQRGWRTLKFYFMCGLPTETDEDLQGIVDLTEQAIVLGKKYCGRNFQLNISLSPFIPKPQTPFQWHAQPTIEEFERKYRYIETRINRKFVSLKKHSVRESIIEGVLSRGDRRVAKAIHRAWQLGCKFDNWHEHLRFELWQQAFEECGIDAHFFASRERGKDEVLAWDHVDASLGKRFLWKEKTRSELVKVTDDCSISHCVGCEVCDFKEVKNLLSIREDGEFVAPPAPAERERRTREAVQRMRFAFTKTGALRFISHLDLQKVMQLIFRRAGLRVAYTQGFNPQPKLQFAPPLPMGFESDGELLDVFFAENYLSSDILEKLNPVALDGLAWLGAEDVELHGPSLPAEIQSAVYRIEIRSEDISLNRDEISRAIAAFNTASEFNVQFENRGKIQPRDLKKSIVELNYELSGDSHVFIVQVSLRDYDYVNPVAGLEHVLGVPFRNVARTRRTQLALQREEQAAVV